MPILYDIQCPKCGTHNVSASGNCRRCGYRLTVREKITMTKPKSLFWTILLIIILIGVLIVYAVHTQSQQLPSESDFASVSESVESMSYNDKRIYLAFDKNMTAEQFYAVKAILEAVGVKDLQNVQRDNSLLELCCEDCREVPDAEAYKASVPDVKNIIFCLVDNYVHCVYYMGNPLYEDDKAVAQLTDYALTETEIAQFQLEAKNIIEKQVLKTPLRAVYPDLIRWNIYRNKNNFIVSSYADVMNLDALVKRAKFKVVFAKDTSISSLTFDGDSYKIK